MFTNLVGICHSLHFYMIVAIYDCSGPPPKVPNGVWIGNETYVTIKCYPGYEFISGNETLVCPDDQWLGEIPVCYRS